MPVFKAVNKHYWKEKDFRNLVFYVVNKNGTVNLCGAQAVLAGDAQGMFQQMMDVKKYFHKEKNRKALHYILSFSKEEKYIGRMEALQIGYAIAACFKRWQVVFGIHEDTDSLHIHFVVNGTSFEDGKAFDMSYGQLLEIQEYAKVLTGYYYRLSLPIKERRKGMFQRIEGMDFGKKPV